MVKPKYECEHCGKDFTEKKEAEEHEQIPLNTLPFGFIYFGEDLSHPGATSLTFTGEKEYYHIVIDKRSVEEDHDVLYYVLRLDPEADPEAKDRPPFVVNSRDSSYIKEKIAKRSRARLLKPHEVCNFLIRLDERILDLRDRGVDRLVLDLEGRVEVPLEVPSPQ